jgi:NCS1 family nucleobase:cation symporter-1
LVERTNNTLVIVVGAATFTVATIGINIVANFVSPAHDLANVAPKYIDFRRGGVITAVALVPGSVVPLFGTLAPFSWFIGAALGALCYLAITSREPAPAVESAVRAAPVAGPESVGL